MIFWTKKDSDNLASIAESLERLADREQERDAIGKHFPRVREFLNRQKDSMTKIKVIESPSLEDEALEESLNIAQRMNAKVTEAQRSGNIPFVVEDLFEAEELENL